MSRPSTETTEQARTATETIRQTIAHFFGNESEGKVLSRITDHTLRDIGVDPTVYDYL